MSAQHKVAVLDVDGTLYPGALGIELLHVLRHAGVCDPESVESVLDVLRQHQGGMLDFSTMAARAYQAYAAALANREVKLVEALASEVWATQRHRLFEFVPALVRDLRAQDYELMLISGSPVEMIQRVAEELDIAAAHGAVFTREDGRYTGAVDLSSGVPGEKARIFRAVTRERELCLERCFAIGDSMTDVGLFEHVGLALVFEPGPELSTLAAERGWASADRDDVLAHTRDLLHPGAAEASARPTRDVRGLPC